MDALENVRMEIICREFRYRGRLLVRLMMCQPHLENHESIHSFYRQMGENLLLYAQEKAKQMEKLLREGTREERMAMRELHLRYSARVMFADEKYVSILWEISRSFRGERPMYSRMAQTFSLERETLLPITAFGGKKGRKLSEDTPYYLSENGVVLL